MYLEKLICIIAWVQVTQLLKWRRLRLLHWHIPRSLLGLLKRQLGSLSGNTTFCSRLFKLLYLIFEASILQCKVFKADAVSIPVELLHGIFDWASLLSSFFYVDALIYLHERVAVALLDHLGDRGGLVFLRLHILAVPFIP